MNNEVKAHLLGTVSSLKFSLPSTYRQNKTVKAEIEAGGIERLETGKKLIVSKIENIYV